jgi:predicted hotdog family 3-hydroxylacyl-ACP dehydratase
VTESLPPIDALLPQTGPMRLLEGVLAHDAESTRCLVDPARSALFRDASGRVPAWVGIEYMAQCIAAHGGLLARARGGSPHPGLLLGARRLVFRCDGFEQAPLLQVTARHAAGRSRMLAFECAVLHPDTETPLVEGRLHVMAARDLGGLAGSAA